MLLLLTLLALSPKDIQKFFTPIVQLAKHLIRIHHAKQPQGKAKLPVVTVSDLNKT